MIALRSAPSKCCQAYSLNTIHTHTHISHMHAHGRTKNYYCYYNFSCATHARRGKSSTHRVRQRSYMRRELYTGCPYTHHIYRNRLGRFARRAAARERRAPSSQSIGGRSRRAATHVVAICVMPRRVRFVGQVAKLAVAAEGVCAAQRSSSSVREKECPTARVWC